MCNDGKDSKGTLADVGSKYRQLIDTELELCQLRRELAKVKMERDILKKKQTETYKDDAYKW